MTAVMVSLKIAPVLNGRSFVTVMRSGQLDNLLHFLEPLHRSLSPRRARSRALDAQLDQALDELRVLQLRRFPQLGEHRHGGAAGKGVDLVDEDAIGSTLEEEVAAREARGA